MDSIDHNLTAELFSRPKFHSQILPYKLKQFQQLFADNVDLKETVMKMCFTNDWETYVKNESYL